MISKIVLKSFLILVVGAAVFASGYFWAMKTMDHMPDGKAASTTEKTGDMGSIPGMGGMAGMAPGMVMISPEKQQLTGVRIATVERRPMVRTVRSVG
ncbi:MAG TPA: hypothetical protein VMR88_18130, partial [Candidatus Polarisedimenticolaceae bacterium]|nr:hypothetical protein [Candidatus Polarisedimenticolaceae bacterium]